MKTVLGLDLGTTSIGWALVNQAESGEEKSSIIRTGVRVNPLSTDELGSFEKGKAITTNAARTLKRGARRNLQRYKLRRDNLIDILKREGWITEQTVLSENGKNSTFSTYAARSKAAKEEISLEDFARVLLMINKKRGYKSSRKTVGNEDGHLIDGMSVARKLYDDGITPGQYCLSLFEEGKRRMPDFYKSDLCAELDSIWNFQSKFYNDILSDELKEQIVGKSRVSVSKLFFAKFGINTAENKGKERKYQAYKWRVSSLSEQLPIEVLVYVISDICGDISNSSGYLGNISDRSKELVFSGKTVGEYLYEHIMTDKSFTAKNKVFYRQDYLDGFNKIWEVQSSFHKELTDSVKSEIRDVVIFYQRRLKSQKGLISFCEFENRCRVAPRSSIVFQEFKIWQNLNNVEISGPGIDGSRHLTIEEMQALSNELAIKDKMTIGDAFILLFGSKKGYEANFKTLEGNRTLCAFYRKWIEIVNASGHGEFDLDKLSRSKADEIISSVFSALGFAQDLLKFDSSLSKSEYEKQPLFRLWHLLYSYEGDSSKTGDASLIEKIGEICWMPEEYSRILSGIVFQQDYASLSHKAISKILPFLKEGNAYDMACLYAGYRHSKSSLTADEIENKVLVPRLDILKKNTLRNPVVEKILNQMVNVVNEIGDMYGRPDEIHIEMARSLKQTAAQREAATQNIAAATKENERITAILRKDFNISYVRPNDILRYKLYDELKGNGYKTLYSDTLIRPDELFSDKIDIEHIIPQALLFNDSYANKTLEFKDVNREKGRETALDFVSSKYGEERRRDYITKVEDLFKRGVISRTKRENLLMSRKDIPEDFVLRDLTCSQYIAKYAKEMLETYVKVVIPTSGKVTKRIREDWQLVDVMKELNLPKYRAIGETSLFEASDGSGKVTERIDNWTKRNDHRHHAMDAITIAFTTPSHIKTLNTLSAREAEGAARLPAPMPLKELRAECRKHLESTLVSIKAKNKVVTRNVNRTKCRGGVNETVTLTPRGELHKEQVYGLRKIFETYFVSVGSKLTEDIARNIASQKVRNRILEQLAKFGGDAKKAFAAKNIPEGFPQKVKCVRFKNVFCIRKNIDASLVVEKVMDAAVRKLLQDRLDSFGGDQTKAFANLDENPIWLDERKRIPLKRVTIAEPFNLCALHSKKDKDGKVILDENGYEVPSDFVNLRNNHHVAIYMDANGNLQEDVVTFFDALNRVTGGYPVVDRDYHKSEGWKFLFSMKANEMFVLPDKENGFFPEEIDLTNPVNYAFISPHLFRVQKIGSKYYCFRHHLETVLNDDKKLQGKTWVRITSVDKLKGAVKVRINHIGQIVAIGEYD